MTWKLKIAAFLISVSMLVSTKSGDIMRVGSLNSNIISRRLGTTITWSQTSFASLSSFEVSTEPSSAPIDDSSGPLSFIFSLPSRLIDSVSNVISSTVGMITGIFSSGGGSIDSSSPSESLVPSQPPSSVRSNLPSESNTPSLFHSTLPSQPPTLVHSDPPSNIPSEEPSNIPSNIPSILPSQPPTLVHSDPPSNIPSEEPSNTPSNIPSILPSQLPTDLPSTFPSIIPSMNPSVIPSLHPSVSFEPTKSVVWTMVGNQIVGKSSEQIGKRLALSADSSRIVQSGKKSLKVYDLASTWSENADLSSNFPTSDVKITLAMTPDGLSIVAGQPQDDGTGFACLLVDDGSAWTNVGTISGVIDQNVGSSVGISDDGSSVFVGADGDDGLAVYQHSYDGATLSYDVTIQGVAKGFGASLAINSLGTMIVIGAPYDGSSLSGSAFIHSVSDPSVQLAEFKGNIAAGAFGSSVSMSSDGFRVAVGGNVGMYMHVYDWNEDTNLYENIAVRVTTVESFGGNVALSSDGKRLAVTAQKAGGQFGGKIFLYLIYEDAYTSDENFGLANIGPISFDENDEQLGSGVAINHNGTFVVCGAKAYGANEGAIRLYESDR